MKGLDLKKLREQKKLTQEELGVSLGKSMRTVITWEKSDKLSIGQINQIKAVFEGKDEVTSQLNESASEYKPKQKEGAEFDNLSFEGKLKEIYGAIMSIKNDAKENKEFIRREKRLNLENFASLQEQLFEFEEELKELKSKKKLS